MTHQQQGNKNHNYLVSPDSQHQVDEPTGEFLHIGCSLINNLLSATYQQCISNNTDSFITPEWFTDLTLSYKEECYKKREGTGFFYEAIATILITLTERFNKEAAIQILKQALRSTSPEFPGKTSILREQFHTRMYQ